MENDISAPRSLTPQQHADLQHRLDNITKAQDTIEHALEEIRGLLTPCYGQRDGEHCYLQDRHRGPHMSPEGTEWMDES